MSKVLLVLSDVINEKYKLHCSQIYNSLTNRIDDIKNIESVERLDILLTQLKLETLIEIKTVIESRETPIKTIGIISDNEINFEFENTNIEFSTEKDWFKQFINVEIFEAKELLELMETTEESKLNKNYVIMNDIDMKEIVCHSIGKVDKEFSGSFNGNNKNIIINKIGENFNGFFGFIKKSSIIENINLVFNINDYFINNYYSSGALCGKNDKGLINNCIVKFNENLNFNNISKEVNYTGGLCGYNAGLINHCNVSFNGLILNTHFNFGVICGYNSGVVNNTNVSITKDCKVYLSKDKYSNMGFLNGINDKKDAIITNCMGAFGNVSIFNADTSFNIGGIVGYNYFGLINGCNILFNGDFEIENESFLGGIAYTNNGSILNSVSIFKKCKNIKNVINNPGKIIDVNVLIYNDKEPINEILTEEPIEIKTKEVIVVEDGTNWFWIILLIVLTIVLIFVTIWVLYNDYSISSSIIKSSS
jgi:hypothetical protein